ncbi:MULTISPECIES: hypothetical protein [Acinetobacter calcoaceticus/baumannii complex]|uniref:hypothetical protein n=1 Tax=Acinetobacter calcoaceticus/baumannii complex TaxID=909768 RepID=UPI001ADCE775|nr:MULTISPECIES: hypothetical protein [Acinetobacter calcoaceticus/baumannii complex]MBO8209952.1 hypothetical protein [Acinetobacter nosocomialis]MBO8226465.1 hypothetical protein [Acinetobacter nosocomialis]MBO8251809.1 hypothetical protein [Acinetobacter nosocomialis]MDC4657640.1 hypothetical protein [Acinetobacter baumannii]MDC4774973.1 hypothetical protein [Acinetobacter baumannii]
MLSEYLHEIAQKSKHGDITWTQPNPSVFQWYSEEQNMLVTIQQASTLKTLADLFTPDKVSYLFQVVDKSKKQTLVSISSKERPEFFEQLNEIYIGAKQGIDQQSSSVLARLLGH